MPRSRSVFLLVWDLLLELTRLALSEHFDAILIESTGVSEPQQVAETFTFELEPEQEEEEQGEEHKFEFANVVLLNKTDFVHEKKIQAIQQLVKVLNSTAQVVLTRHSKVPCETILKTGLFNLDVAARSARWLKSLQDEIKPVTEEYGISSFVYRARTPFHPQKIHQFLEKLFLLELVTYDEIIEEEKAMNKEAEADATREASKDTEDDPNNQDDEEDVEAAKKKRDATYFQCQKYMKAHFGQIFRSKGFMWLAGRDSQFAEWSQAVASKISCKDPWLAMMPKDMLPEEGSDAGIQVEKDILPGLIQDRRQEIVFIGQDLKQEALIKALDECLLKPEDNPQTQTTKGSNEDEIKNGWKFGWKPKDAQMEGDSLPTWPSVEDNLMALMEGEDNDEEEDHEHEDDVKDQCDVELKQKKLKTM